MKRIFLILCLVLIFGNNNISAENDINKLSEEDQLQCKEMEKKYEELRKYLQGKKSIKLWYSFHRVYRKNIQIFNKLDYKFFKKDFNFENNFLNAEWQKSFSLLFQYNIPIGVDKINDSYHNPIEDNDFDHYNIGYLINVVDFYGDRFRVNNLRESFLKDIKTLSYVVFVKEKPKRDISYIKINNCFVEEYYINFKN